MKDANSAANSALVMRRVLLNQVDELIKPEEVLSRDTVVPWNKLGSLERQCDLLEKLIKEIKSSKFNE